MIDLVRYQPGFYSAQGSGRCNERGGGGRACSTVGPEYVLLDMQCCLMMSERDGLSRRTVLHLLGAGPLAGLAGCASSSQNNEQSESVPKAYRTARSLGGEKRDPDNLRPKESVNYQSDSPNQSKCASCRYYISDKNSDGRGACSKVKGTIKPKAWCSLYAPYQTEQG